jgi:hypothetical protein
MVEPQVRDTHESAVLKIVIPRVGSKAEEISGEFARILAGWWHSLGARVAQEW